MRTGKPKYGICRTCEYPHALHLDGTVRRHKFRHWMACIEVSLLCPGTGRTPKPGTIGTLREVWRRWPISPADARLTGMPEEQADWEAMADD